MHYYGHLISGVVLLIFFIWNLTRVPSRIHQDKEMAKIEHQALLGTETRDQNMLQIAIADAWEESRTGNARFHWLYASILLAIASGVAMWLFWTA